MANKCEICNKTTDFGNSVSHSHLKTKRRREPNIQSINAKINGQKKRVKICTSCLKAGKVEKFVK